MIASHMAENLAGKVVKQFHNKWGDAMLARTSDEAYGTKMSGEVQQHVHNINEIHKKHNALPPIVYKWPHKTFAPHPAVVS